MESNILVNKLKAEGFSHVFEWVDGPNTEYPPHSHKGRVSFYIKEGCVTLNFGMGNGIMLCKGERCDVIPGKQHSAKVGPQGCSWVVGEEIEGDA